MPKAELEYITQRDEIYGFMSQGNISARNFARLRELSESENARIAMLAGLVLEVAQVKPRKRRRRGVLKRERPDLLDSLIEEGLMEEYVW